MKRILLLVILFILGVTTNLYSQTDRIFTHWMFEKMAYNPGATAIKGNICGTLIYRNQWDKWRGAPNSFVFNAEGAYQKWNSGFGLTFTHDAIGFHRSNKLYLNYAYHLSLPIGQLGFGAGFGFVNLSRNADWIPPQTLNDFLLVNQASGFQFDMNLGLFFQANTGYYVGVSMTHLPGLRFKTINGVNTRHLIVAGGYRFNLKGDFDLEPQVKIISDFVAVSFDINLMAYWRNIVYAGLSYRFEDAVAIMAGVNLNNQIIPSMKSGMNFKIGYSYDIPANNTLLTFNRGTHEIFMKFCLMPPKKPITKSVHPRWL